jgi:hypothetical protein
MSLPGRWTDGPAPLLSSPISSTQSPRLERRFQKPSYVDQAAVTQFCNDHFKDLDDLQNTGQLITSLKEQQTIVTAQVTSFPSLI